MHQLRRQLKALKLGGMLDTLAQRLAQAEQGHLGFLDFLEVLLEDEVQRRAPHGLARRLAQARFEALKTVEDIDFGADPGLPVQPLPLGPA